MDKQFVPKNDYDLRQRISQKTYIQGAERDLVVAALTIMMRKHGSGMNEDRVRSMVKDLQRPGLIGSIEDTLIDALFE